MNRNKKKAKTKAKKKVAKKASQELVIRVEQPTMRDLEPMKEAGKFTIQKTWLSEKQILRMVQRTPAQHIFKRPGKGGKIWSYVTGNYVEKVLNYSFGWNWDFEIMSHGKEEGHIWVLGKLTVKNPEGTRTITKTQFGRAEVKRTQGKLLDYGNDLKAAATDSLKKAASLLGIASDIYGKSEFKEETGKEPIDESPQAREVEIVKEEEGHRDYTCYGIGKGGCGNDMTEAEYNYSMKVYGKPLCRNHQEMAKKK